MENLVTSCQDCNRGKSDIKIGTIAPETEKVRRKRLQELMELRRAAEELDELSQSREDLNQMWVNEICKIAGSNECSNSIAKASVKLSKEFGSESVIDWLDFTLGKFSASDSNATKYLYGIARRTREDQA